MAVREHPIEVVGHEVAQGQTTRRCGGPGVPEQRHAHVPGIASALQHELPKLRMAGVPAAAHKATSATASASIVPMRSPGRDSDSSCRSPKNIATTSNGTAAILTIAR